MSKTSAIIALIMGLTIVCLSLWVKSLKTDIVNRDQTIEAQVKTIAEKDKANKDLSTANTVLSNQVAAERQASADRAAKIKELEDKLKDKKGKYENATKNDQCANTAAPDAVLDLMQ